MPLITDADEFLVTFKSSDEPDAMLGVAKLKLTPEGQFKVLWKLPVNSMFYSARSAQNTPAYKKYFDQNQPDPDFKYFYLLPNKNLLVMYLQHIAMIDTQTGKLLWIRKQ